LTCGFISTCGLTLLPEAAARCGILGLEGPAAGPAPARGRAPAVPDGLADPDAVPVGFGGGTGLLAVDALGGIAGYGAG
jgi:hypothetical protein